MTHLDELEKLTLKAQKLHLADLEHHIFLCCDQTKPKCCTSEQGLASWNYLKKRLKELQLVNVHRSKANCLRVCCAGPIMVIYPQGIWYHHCTPDTIERILQQHVIGGKPVEEFIFSIR